MSNSPSRRPSPSRSTAIHDPAVLTTPTAPMPASSGPQGDILLQGAHKLKREFFCEELPEDILHHIQSLLPVRDAARVACVSRGFLRAWRCYSKLVLNHHTIGLTDMKFEQRETYFIDRVGQILENHHNNGVLVETLQLQVPPSCRNIKASCLDRWLQITVKSGIKELDLSMPASMMAENYRFLCSVLSDEAAANSIQYLRLRGCNFYPMSTLGLLRRLTSLNLMCVHTTGEGLGHLLSTSSVLEQLYLYQCSGIICLQIPSTLKKLSILSIILCSTLKVVELDAPNLCTFDFGGGGGGSKTSLRNSSQLKNVTFSWILLSNAHVWLPSIASNVESLTLCSPVEDDNMPIIPSKIHHLKKLQIRLVRSMSAFHTSYDVFCLVSFLDASPIMDSFILRLGLYALMPDLDVGDDDDEYAWRKLERRYDQLRQVTIMGFCASKSLVELTSHIIESAPSLERLTLDTTYGYTTRSGTPSKCPSTNITQCSPLSDTDLAGARKAVEDAGRYIAGRVPSTVLFEVLEPCNVCHSSDQ